MPEWSGQSKSVHIDKNAGIGWSTCPEFAVRSCFNKFSFSKKILNRQGHHFRMFLKRTMACTRKYH